MRGWSEIIKNIYINKIFWPFFGILILFFIDRLSKILSIKYLSDEGFFLIPNTTGFVLEWNQGIAYSIPLSGIYLIFILILIILILGALAVKAYRQHKNNIVLSIGLIIAGATSNLIDRFMYDNVIDILVLTKWPVFNIADLMILAGGIWLVTIYLKKK
ncbi:MAG: signal peptidase II [Candidatus Kerfeldbacteria bacterium]